MRLFARAFGWFVDEDDFNYSPWRGVLLWVLVVAFLVGVGALAVHFGWDGSNGNCTSNGAQTGSC